MSSHKSNSKLDSMSSSSSVTVEDQPNKQPSQPDTQGSLLKSSSSGHSHNPNSNDISNSSEVEMVQLTLSGQGTKLVPVCTFCHTHLGKLCSADPEYTDEHMSQATCFCEVNATKAEYKAQTMTEKSNQDEGENSIAKTTDEMSLMKKSGEEEGTEGKISEESSGSNDAVTSSATSSSDTSTSSASSSVVKVNKSDLGSDKDSSSSSLSKTDASKSKTGEMEDEKKGKADDGEPKGSNSSSGSQDDDPWGRTKKNWKSDSSNRRDSYSHYTQSGPKPSYDDYDKKKKKDW